MHRLQDSVAVVVAEGAAGEAVVRQLAAEGAQVLTTLVGGPEHDHVFRWDGGAPSGRADVEALIGAAVERFGHLDVLVLPAGTAEDGALEALDDTAWTAAVAELETLVWGVREGLRHMVPRGSGRIVVTTVAEAKVGRAGAGVVATVAHAAYGLVKVAAKEAGPSGVTVNAVLAAGAEGSLIGRGTAPDEVAAAVLLLAAPDGAGMTGVAFPVDGGVAPY
jgi:3-hydroxybutyrate dehydrogenase